MKRIKFLLNNKLIKRIIIPLRNSLDKNKIFFEIISSILLTFASLAVSCASNQINTKTKEISEKQLEILENDREPYFTIKSQIDDEISENYDYSKKIYTIKNEGGLITGAYIPEISTYIYVNICNNNTDIGKTYILKIDYIFESKNAIYSIYDNTNREFKLCKHESNKLNNLLPRLDSALKEIFLEKGNHYTFTTDTCLKNIIEIDYINYQNIEFNQKFQIIDDDQLSLVKINNNIEIKDDEDTFFIGAVGIDENFEQFEEAICGLIESTFKFGGNEDALEVAEHYLSAFPCSRESLIEQLNERDIFTYESAVYAADNCGVDWNEQAVKTAKNYLFLKPHSYNQLLEALTSIEKFTYDQAIYGINNCEVDWNEQAKRRIQEYVYSNKTNSYDELIQLLENEGYTHDQAVYGVEQTGYNK